MHVEVVVNVRKENAYDFKNIETAQVEIEGSVPVLLAGDWGSACGCLVHDTIKKASRTFRKREAEELAEAEANALAKAPTVAQEEEAKEVPLRPPDKTGP